MSTYLRDVTLEDTFTVAGKLGDVDILNSAHHKGLARDFWVTGTWQKSFDWQRGAFRGKCR